MWGFFSMSVHQPVYVWFMELSAYIITKPYKIKEIANVTIMGSII